ncbi:hypothetical protein D3C81_1089900 [compost metagenome]
MATGMAINAPPSNLAVATRGAGCEENIWESRTGSMIIMMSAACPPDRIHIPMALRKTSELRSADLNPTSQSRCRLNLAGRCVSPGSSTTEREAASITESASDT